MRQQGGRRHYVLWLGTGAFMLLVLSGVTLYLLNQGQTIHLAEGATGTPTQPEQTPAQEATTRPEDPVAEDRDAPPGALGTPGPTGLEATTTPVAADTTDPRLVAARGAAARAEWAEALRLYDLLVAEPGTTPELLAERARVLAWSGDYAAAADGLDAALAQRPTQPEWLFDRARFLWWGGQLEAAEAAIAAYLRVRPGDPEAIVLQDQIRNGLEPDVAAASAWLAERDTPLARLWLARAYARAGRPAEALEYYRGATASNAFPPSLLLEFASIALTADSARVAAAALEQYLWRHHPEDRDARIRLARAYAWAGLHEKGIVTYRDLLAVGEDPTLRFELAQLYAWSGRDRLAEEELHRVLALHPEHAASLKLLGDLARWRGVPALAAERYRAALAADPEDAEVRDALREVEQAQAVIAAVARTRERRDGWEFGADGFQDSESFVWFAAQGARSWGSAAYTLRLAVREEYLAGPRRSGDDFRSFGTGAHLELRFPLGGGWAAGVGGGVQHFTRIGTFPTWSTWLEWLDERGNALQAGYARRPAAQGAQTAASLGAEMISDALRLSARGSAGGWSLASEFAAERFDSRLGRVGRGSGSVVVGRTLAPGLSARGLVRGIFADRSAPVFEDWGTLVWTPRYFVMPGAQLAYESSWGERWELGARLGAGYAFLEERGLVGWRYDQSRTAILEAGLDVGYRTDGWLLHASGDWGGAVPTGYRAAALRLRISTAGAPR